MEASSWTPVKQEFFRGAIRPCFAITSAVQRKYDPRHPMLYFDLTPGPGWINIGDERIKGSPLIALEVLRNHPQMQANCLFTEKDADCANELSANVASEQSEWSIEDHKRISVIVRAADHTDVLLERKYYSRYGLLYWDGLGRNPYPACEINSWLHYNSQHDLLIMASGNAPKRAKRDRLGQLLRTVPRQVWLSDTYTAWQWIFAVATNYSRLAEQMSAYGITMYQADSWRGKQILRLLDTTRYKNGGYEQQGLFNE